MNSKEINGTKLSYEIIGTGTPTVILHGWSVDHRLMSGCLEPVFHNTATSFKRIYIDLPGMGQSIPGEDIKDSHDILRVLFALLDDLLPEQPFLLIGESYGGLLARAIIKERPKMVSGVVLLCPLVVPGYHKGHVEPLKVMEQDDAFLATLTNEERAYFTGLGIRLTKEVWERFKEQILSGILLGDSYFLNHVLKGEFQYDVDALSSPYEGPALIITGKQDTEVGYVDQFELQKQYCNATYVALAAAGHNAQIEQPVMFAGIVSSFLTTYFS